MEKKARSKIILVAVIAVALIAGFWIWKSMQQKNFMYAGTVEATRVDMPSRVSTVIDSIDVQEGDRVDQGQILAKLSCEDLQIQNKLITDQYRRNAHLHKTGGISDEVFEQFQNRKDDSDTRLSWCALVSPLRGVVMTRYLEPKEWVNPGTKILSLADIDHPWAYFYVPQKVMSSLKVGASIQGTVPEMDHETFYGKIIKINDEAEFTPKNVQTQAERTRLVFGVKVMFENPQRKLKPGMTVESTL